MKTSTPAVLCAWFAAFIFLTASLAQTPPPPAKRLPPAGIKIPQSGELSARVANLRRELDLLSNELKDQPRLAALLPDIEIFHKAVDWALRYDEFFDPKQLPFAQTLLDQAFERIRQLRSGQAPWLDASGLIVRGYRSQLDLSVQPYGLFVPAEAKRTGAARLPLLVWLLGRNDKRTELAFLAERERPGLPFQLENSVVLVPYGRFCNATKFAGEADVFEAISAVRSQYPIDSNRIAVAGFSMGGASVWHLAAHHAGFWCAASPGAGFAETAIYTKAFTAGGELPPIWEQQLWNWYDATACAANLFNCPTIAYSGELDPQKLSADLMEKAMAAEGLKLERLIGPRTAHQYEPATRKVLAARLDALIAKGREAVPNEVRLTTYTLRYPEVAWVRVEGLEQHWKRADVRARRSEPNEVTVTTTNITALHLSPPGIRRILIDGQKIELPETKDKVSLLKHEKHWTIGSPAGSLRKRPGLTGPIDDAFMSAFIFVRPSGPPLNTRAGQWADHELAHAQKMWRDIFRAEPRVIPDSAISERDIASNNLVLWGDPSSNRLLARILARLPLEWTAEKLIVNSSTYDSAHCMPVLIFPNPLNPEHYVVLNSGIDFRDDAYGTNAKQTPKLPDWAVIDLRTSPNARWPGQVLSAGFFNEQWQPAAPGP